MPPPSYRHPVNDVAAKERFWIGYFTANYIAQDYVVILNFLSYVLYISTSYIFSISSFLLFSKRKSGKEDSYYHIFVYTSFICFVVLLFNLKHSTVLFLTLIIRRRLYCAQCYFCLSYDSVDRFCKFCFLVDMISFI